MILGVIADDFTGATDVASMLVRAGMRTVQVIGVPTGDAPTADAVVVALKSRTTPRDEAVDESLRALRWLKQGGARQIYFKYCSTFDSTDEGNIGPVGDALMDALDAKQTIACPALPENGRTIFKGHLFVGDALLSDSSMRDHPLTPMRDANLVHVLQAQTPRTVGLTAYNTVGLGVEAIQAQWAQHPQTHWWVVDAIDNASLATIAQACADLPLITAGSGVALGLPKVYEQRGWLTRNAQAAQLDTLQGRALVLSGSCSAQTLAQVAQWIERQLPAYQLDPLLIHADPEQAFQQALAWLSGQQEPALIYASANQTSVKRVQHELGVVQAGALIETMLARLAKAAVAQGVNRIVVAGGETSGAVVQALNVKQLRIGHSIAPGVPWTQAVDRPLQLALKSGNFGGVDFFFEALHTEAPTS
jgi:uncharacterized protein YgbK (DUF1537 family)